jgi:hypothetical protein
MGEVEGEGFVMGDESRCKLVILSSRALRCRDCMLFCMAPVQYRGPGIYTPCAERGITFVMGYQLLVVLVSSIRVSTL